MLQSRLQSLDLSPKSGRWSYWFVYINLSALEVGSRLSEMGVRGFESKCGI